MESHPIPQDVTGFQFKLIGNMTVKQFLYLAASCLIGWFFYTLPVFSFFKIILASSWVLFGFALAFLPIEGRPMDIMVFNFLKALFIPNQYIYDKKGGLLISHIHFQKHTPTSVQPTLKPLMPLEKILQQAIQSPPVHKNKLDEREESLFTFFSSFWKDTKSILQTQPTPTKTPEIITMHELPKEAINDSGREKQLEESLEKEAGIIRKELEAARKTEVQTAPNHAQEAHLKVTELEKQLQETLTQKDQLEKDLAELQKKLAEHKQTIPQPERVATQAKVLPTNMTKTVGLSVPEDANVITGIVKDSRGNILSNILIEVKDTTGNSVRAFKTNLLGQFASATPLLNGNYSFELEDPNAKHKFSPLTFEAKGEIIQPFEITSFDEREELRRQLFS